MGNINDVNHGAIQPVAKPQYPVESGIGISAKQNVSHSKVSQPNASHEEGIAAPAIAEPDPIKPEKQQPVYGLQKGILPEKPLMIIEEVATPSKVPSQIIHAHPKTSLHLPDVRLPALPRPSFSKRKSTEKEDSGLNHNMNERAAFAATR